MFFTGAALAQSPAPGSNTPVVTSTDADPSDIRPELKEALPQGRLIGKGRLTVWGFQVYDARLWVPAGFGAGSYTSQPLALELAYLRAFDAVGVADRSLKEMARSVAISDAQAAQWKAEML
ncbi:MAG: hypothetical protein JF626_12405, partial [Polaromonas sp.]|nr:hypothetical protein [Polaromonas sp.]